MGCVGSKDVSGGAEHAHLQASGNKISQSPAPTRAKDAILAAGDNALTPVGRHASMSSDTSLSEASTWDMRSMAGPLLLDSMESGTPFYSSSPIVNGTLGKQLPPPSPAASVSARLRSPSILGMPALDTPVAPTPSDSPIFRVTKAGGCTFVNQYLVVQYLGRGTSGRVFLCMDAVDKRLYAVKIVRKTPQIPAAGEEGALQPTEETPAATPSDPSTPSTATNNVNNNNNNSNDQPPAFGSGSRRLRRPSKSKRDPLDDLLHEISVMRKVGSHPNVVALREVVDDPTSAKMLIVMEYCEGGPVLTRSGLERGRRIPEPVARGYFRHMAAALGYLHSCHVVHGDLKPENVLMAAAGRVALSDFGCSKVMEKEGEVLDRCNGTPAFLAPEMMSKGATFRGRPADVYALGACLYTFIYGRIPFTATTVSELFDAVRTKELEFPPTPEVSPHLIDLLEGLLKKDPSERMTLDQAAVHPWTTDGGRLSPLPLAAEHHHQHKKKKGGKKGVDNSTAYTGYRNNSTTDPDDGDESLAALLTPDLEVQTYSKGQYLLRQGSRCGVLLYILQGEVDVLYRPQPTDEVVEEEERGGVEVEGGVSVQDGVVEVAGSFPSSGQQPGSGQAERLGAGEREGNGAAGCSATTSAGALPVNKVKDAAPSPVTLSTKTPLAAASVAESPSLSSVTVNEQGQQEGDDAMSVTESGTTEPLQEIPSRSLSGALKAALGPSKSKIWSPSSRRSRRRTLGDSSLPPARGLTPQLSSALSAFGNTPEPSPRLGATSSSFNLGMGLGPATSTQFGSVGIESYATTPGVTPLPSARGATPDPNGVGGGGGGGGSGVQGLAAAVSSMAAAAEVSASEVSGGPPLDDTAAAIETVGVDTGAPIDNASVSTPGARQSLGIGSGLEAGAVGGYSPLVAGSVPPTPGSAVSSILSAHPVLLTPTEEREGAEGGSIDGDGDNINEVLGEESSGRTPGTTPLAQAQTPGTPAAATGATPSPLPAATAAAAVKVQEEGKEEPAVKAPKELVDAASSAEERVAALARGKDFLMAVRGPGDFLGEMALIGGSGLRRSCSVIAASDEVRVVVIPYPVAKAHFRRFPVAKQRLAEMVWARQSEMIVLEALLRLAAAKKELNEG